MTQIATERVIKLSKVKEIKNEFQFEGGISTENIEWLIEQAERVHEQAELLRKFRKALKKIAESDDDSSCNELALKYEVIADTALNC